MHVQTSQVTSIVWYDFMAVSLFPSQKWTLSYIYLTN